MHAMLPGMCSPSSCFFPSELPAKVVQSEVGRLQSIAQEDIGTFGQISRCKCR